MRGVGWVILFQDPATDRLTNHWITLHQDGVPAGFKPLLVMDVWEHAFMRDYKATERDQYIEAFFRNIDWAAVEARLQEDRRRAARSLTCRSRCPLHPSRCRRDDTVTGARALLRPRYGLLRLPRPPRRPNPFGTRLALVRA